MVDLRSDTVTRPTPAMRKAMADADVGDDVYGEDPTINRLEEEAAEMMGCEASLFMPSGTMGNQTALFVHCRPGSEVVVEARSHILNYEMAAMATISGLLPNAIYTEDGIMKAEEVLAAIRPDIYYYARTRLVALENTHNMAGGRVIPLEVQRDIQSVARDKGLALHLDGARIFNAAAFLGVPAREVAAGFDSVMFCLSKGLGAPVGSMLCGSAPFITEARRVRKMLGGGMRQAGVIAAAGRVALQEMVPRVAEDNDLARRLAEDLKGVPGLVIIVPPESNILILTVGRDWYGSEEPGEDSRAEGFVRRLRAHGVLALALDGVRVRMVTHFDLPENTVDRVMQAVASVGR
ncbi:MAG: low-specificity L-threonine aldolase [bacterium]|nr:MAG: low-specificity L-threonine aldolase [bacterium]